MDIGKMRFVLTLEKPLQVANALGEIVLSTNANWESVVDVRASIKALTAEESMRAKQVEMDISHKIVIRYVRELKSDWRLRMDTPDGSRYFYIKGISNVKELNREYELTCVETTNG
jgi:SPP1 family predicted phage head-tail adaptor